MKKILIFGNGQIAEIAKFYFDTDSDYKVSGFIADGKYINESIFNGLPVHAYEDLDSLLQKKDDYEYFIALSYKGMNKLRENVYKRFKSRGLKLISYLSTKCNYLTHHPHGDNCFILEDNTIQPFVKIGHNVTLWSGNHIGHHSKIESHNFISSHVVISGNCTIHSHCFLGVNSTLHNDVVIGQESLLGAGAIVSKSLEAKTIILPPRSNILEKKSDEIDF